MFSPNTKVLIVDDMMTMRKIVAKSLKELGFTTFVEAADGALAWTKLSENPDVGLIVSDWNMPNCTGVEFLKRVRSDSRFKSLPFFLVTAESEKEQVVEALKAGVDGYVIKPFTTDALKGKLEESYNKRAVKAA